jgi:cytochrome b pre-mRNA-processing protein 3
MFTRLRKQPQDSAAAALYRAIVSRAREPVFYLEWGVADTMDGRFDLLTLHVFLVFETLRGRGDAAGALGSELADIVFTGFDEALRELGVSDFGMGRRMRNMADAFYGRVRSYSEAKSAAELAAAIQRDLYRGGNDTADEARGLASYMVEARMRLCRDIAALVAGRPDFGPLPHLVKNDER